MLLNLNQATSQHNPVVLKKVGHDFLEGGQLCVGTRRERGDKPLLFLSAYYVPGSDLGIYLYIIISLGPYNPSVRWTSSRFYEWDTKIHRTEDTLQGLRAS